MTDPIVVGNRRFTCLTPNLVRMEFDPAGEFEDRRSIVAYAEKAPKAFASVEKKGDVTVLDTGFMKILTRENDHAFFPANLQVQWLADGMFQHWTPGDRDHENLGGTIHSLDIFSIDAELNSVHVADELPPDQKGIRWHIPPETHSATPFECQYEWGETEDRLWKEKDSWTNLHAAIRHAPHTVHQKTRNQVKDQYAYAPGVLSRAGYFLLNDSSSVVMDKDDFPIERNRPGTQDWYFFAYGSDYRRALADFILLTGRAPLPTRNTFGIFFSRYPAYDEAEARQIIDRFAKEGIPLSTLVIDMEWHKDSWCHWDWNLDFYPNPKGFIHRLHEEGLEVTLNVHPDSIDNRDSHYEPLRQAIGDFDYPILKNEKKGVEEQRLNLCRKEEAEPFFRICQKEIVETGMDYWWLDGEAGYINGTNPHLITNKLFFEDCLTDKKRSMLLSRYGGIGSHRYGAFFTADTYSEWNTLRMQCEFNIRAGHVGVGYLSHDIGGFFASNSPLIDPRLYVRWVQFGVFNPIFRLHSAPGCGSRQPWDYGEANCDIVRRWLQVRNSLMPYIYTAAYDHYRSGVPLVRGMFVDHPRDEKAYRFDQFLFGDALLIAPTLTPENHRTVYLPEGTWYRFETGETVTGGREFTAAAELSEVLVYVRAGSIIPRQPLTGRPADPHTKDLILDVYPSAMGCGRLYEDDGKSRDYEEGKCAVLNFSLKQVSKKEYELAMEPVPGKTMEAFESVTIRLYKTASGVKEIKLGPMSIQEKKQFTVS